MTSWGRLWLALLALGLVGMLTVLWLALFRSHAVAAWMVLPPSAIILGAVYGLLRTEPPG